MSKSAHNNVFMCRDHFLEFANRFVYALGMKKCRNSVLRFSEFLDTLQFERYVANSGLYLQPKFFESKNERPPLGQKKEKKTKRWYYVYSFNRKMKVYECTYSHHTAWSISSPNTTGFGGSTLTDGAHSSDHIVSSMIAFIPRLSVWDRGQWFQSRRSGFIREANLWM